MGLVDYSDSNSGSEADAPAKAPVKPTSSTGKKPFQKVVDRSNPGKIVVNLPQAAAETKTNGDEPPTKRARTAGGGRFSGFNSFLPAPKNANPAASKSSGSKPGISFKTSAAPGFIRDGGDGDGVEGSSAGGLSLPPPKTQAQPSIPEEQKPEEEVKLVGKPLMFKPLSVARGKKKKTPKAMPMVKPASSSTPAPSGTNGDGASSQTAPAPAPKVSLFSLHTEEPSEPTDSKTSGAYEPLFETGPVADEYNASSHRDYAQYAQNGPAATTAPGTESLDVVVNDLNLSAAERRELFGRGGMGNQAAKKVINFNMDREYEHNEEIRAAGEQQTHNPVRAIQGGKHSLRQLVQNVHNQRDALEDSFAKGKTNRKEASSKYGW